MIDTSISIGSSRFQLVRELTENITFNLKVNSPETLFGLITFDSLARLEFNITRYTDLDTLLLAINPGLPYYGGYSGSNSTTNISGALSLLLSGSLEGGFLQLRNATSKIAVVITNSYDSNYSSLRSIANSLHAANILDVYAIGIGGDRNTRSQLKLIASDPSFVQSTYLSSYNVQQMVEGIVEQVCFGKQHSHSYKSQYSCMAILLCMILCRCKLTNKCECELCYL